MTDIKLFFSTKIPMSIPHFFEIEENILNEMLNEKLIFNVNNTIEHKIDKQTVIAKRIKIEALSISNTFKANSVIEMYCNACCCCIGIFDNNNIPRGAYINYNNNKFFLCDNYLHQNKLIISFYIDNKPIDIQYNTRLSVIISDGQ